MYKYFIVKPAFKDKQYEIYKYWTYTGARANVYDAYFKGHAECRFIDKAPNYDEAVKKVNEFDTEFEVI